MKGKLENIIRKIKSIQWTPKNTAAAIVVGVVFFGALEFAYVTWDANQPPDWTVIEPIPKSYTMTNEEAIEIERLRLVTGVVVEDPIVIRIMLEEEWSKYYKAQGNRQEFIDRQVERTLKFYDEFHDIVALPGFRGSLNEFGMAIAFEDYYPDMEMVVLRYQNTWDEVRENIK